MNKSPLKIQHSLIHFKPPLKIQHSLIHTTIHPLNPNRPKHQHSPTPPNPPPLTLHHPILSKLESSPSPAQFNQIHAHTITTGLFGSAFAASRLLKFSTAISSPPDLPLTHLLFSQIHHPDVYSYNLVIKALSQSSHPLGSLPMYHTLLLQGLHPNDYTFCFLLDCCSAGLALWEGRQVHAHLRKHGLDSTIFSTTSLIHMYGDCGALEDALRAFEQMRQRSNVSWGAAIDACVNHGDVIRGLRLLGEMRSLRVEPSNATLVSTLHACAEVGDMVVGRAVHAYIVLKGLELNVTLGTTLVDMYSKCGAIETATEVFKAMPVRGVASWNCLIHGLAVNGHGDKAVSLFEEMQRELELRPNGVTFIGLLHACSHAGLVEDGIRYFAEMRRVYGVEPSLKHYGCMVDLYGRAGRVEEAMEVVKAMPVEPDAVIWGALFGACRIHGFTELGELVAAQIIKVAPYDTCGYLLLSDTHAMRRNWDDVGGVRKMMREMDIRKVPGFSSISN